MICLNRKPTLKNDVFFWYLITTFISERHCSRGDVKTGNLLYYKNGMTKLVKKSGSSRCVLDSIWPPTIAWSS